MKKLISICIVIIILSINLSAYANHNSPYYFEVDKAVTSLIYNDVEALDLLANEKIRNDNITGEQFAELIVALYAKSQNIKKVDIVVTDNPFNDAENLDVQRAYALGVIGDDFKAKMFISREELAVMIVNFLKLENVNITLNNDLSLYSDKDDISAWAFDALAYCNQEQYIKGSRQEIMPKQKTRISEVIRIIYRIATRYKWLEAPNYINTAGFYLPINTTIKVYGTSFNEDTSIKMTSFLIENDKQNKEKLIGDLNYMMEIKFPNSEETRQIIIDDIIHICELPYYYYSVYDEIEIENYIVELENWISADDDSKRGVSIHFKNVIK